MSNTSFLPEDYLDQKADRRTNVVSLTLFGIVMVAVFAAFLFTNQQWTQVKAAQASINSQYQEAAAQIERLNELERQKNQMLNKAELAAALVERVPRSILLAELINRMPPRLGLLKFDLRSEIVKSRQEPGQGRRTGRLKRPKRAKTRAEAAEEQEKIEAPHYKVSISMVGVAPTDLEVSRYMAELNAYPLIQDVILDYSEEKTFNEQSLRQFAIRMTLNPEMDVREVQPRIKPRGRNPMSDQLQFTSPDSKNTASVRPGGREGG